ncbi:hypothetical protein HYW30_00050 [Candidatus Azambacteria bacterium]|nr:hypothetical protein [Candidatus Azambacteria bacterium]
MVGFGAILLVLAHFLSRTPFVTSLQDRQFWKMVIVMVLVMFVVFLLYPQEILRELSGQESPGGKTLTGYLDSFRYYGSVFLGLEPILAILSLVGVGLLWKTHRRLLWLIFIFTLLYISGLYFLFHHEPRYIILLVPLTAILGAIGLVSLGKAHPAAYTLLFIPLLFVLRYDQLLLRLDSRELLAEEIVRFSPDEKVIGFLPGLRVIPTKVAIRDLESRDPEALRTLERTLKNIPDERYPKEARSIVNLAQVRPERQAMITGYDYEARIEWREENIDIHGLFQGPIWKLFSIERFGPTTELIRL